MEHNGDRGRDLPSRRREYSSVHALTDARFLVALTVLLLNDHVWKHAYGNALTGKLSDFAGMIVLPTAAATIVRLCGFGDRDRVVALVVGVWFAAIKISAAAAAATEVLAETVTGTGHTIVVDPTDLSGLGGLLLAVAILREPRPLFSAQVVRVAAISLALFAVVATSEDDSEPNVDLVLDVETGNVIVRPGFGRVDDEGSVNPVAGVEGAGEFVLSVCAPSDGARCYLADEDRVVETVNGSSKTVWSRDPTSPSRGDVRSWGGERTPERTFVSDMVFDRSGVLHVMTQDGRRAERSLDGTWTPTFKHYRSATNEMILAALVAFMSTAAAAMLRQSRSLALVPLLAFVAYVVMIYSVRASSIGSMIQLSIGFVICAFSVALLVYAGRAVPRTWLLSVPVLVPILLLQPQLALALVPLVAIGLIVACALSLVSYQPARNAHKALGVSVAAAAAATLPFVAWRNMIGVSFNWTYVWLAVPAIAAAVVYRLELTLPGEQTV